MTSNTAATLPALADQTLTASELDRARTYLDQTKNCVIAAIKHVSEPQWTFKPAPDRWSIAEIAEHVVLVQQRILGPIREQLAAAPAGQASPDRERVDDIVIHQFPERLTKFQGPEALNPPGSFTRAEALQRVSANYARLQDYLESTPDLRQHVVKAVPMELVSKGAYQFMDGYQWILAAAAHTERHTKQMLEVMADPRYPE